MEETEARLAAVRAEREALRIQLEQEREAHKATADAAMADHARLEAERARLERERDEARAKVAKAEKVREAHEFAATVWKKRAEDAISAAAEAIAATEEATAAIDGWMNRDKVLTKDALIGGLWMSTIANAFLHMLDTNKDAKNYVESKLAADDGREIVINVRRSEGKIPAELVSEARADRDSLRAQLSALAAEHEAAAKATALHFEHIAAFAADAADFRDEGIGGPLLQIEGMARAALALAEVQR